MKQYIDKSAVVAEIERLDDYLHLSKSAGGQAFVENLLSFLDTLEVKGMDLDRVIDKWICDAAITHDDCSITDIISTAKHFFELGLKARKGGDE